MPNKQARKATAKKTAERRAVPYDLIEKMVDAGVDALTIAKKIGRVNKGDDPTHTVRAIISGMRTKGWKKASGKLQRLKVERVGHTKKTAPKKGKKKTAARPDSKPPVKASTQADGKMLAAGDGKEE